MKNFCLAAISVIILASIVFLYNYDNSFNKFEINDTVTRKMIFEELGTPTDMDSINITWTKDEIPKLLEYQNGILKHLNDSDTIVFQYGYHKYPIKRFLWFVPVGDNLRMIGKLEYNSKRRKY